MYSKSTIINEILMYVHGFKLIGFSVSTMVAILGKNISLWFSQFNYLFPVKTYSKRNDIKVVYILVIRSTISFLGKPRTAKMSCLSWENHRLKRFCLVKYTTIITSLISNLPQFSLSSRPSSLLVLDCSSLVICSI